MDGEGNRDDVEDITIRDSVMDVRSVVTEVSASFGTADDDGVDAGAHVAVGMPSPTVGSIEEATLVSLSKAAAPRDDVVDFIA